MKNADQHPSKRCGLLAACRALHRAQLAGLVCGFADYFGLASALPTLPFFIDEELGAPNSAMTAGLAFTLQYGGVLVGNMVWGRVAHSIGLRRVLLFTLAGDVVFFTASGFAPNVPVLLIMRLCAGMSSPLVPALLQLFAVADRAVVFPQYVLAVLSGYFSGSACGGAIGEEVGFAGACCVSGAVALLALLVVASAPADAFPGESGRAALPPQAAAEGGEVRKQPVAADSEAIVGARGEARGEAATAPTCTLATPAAAGRAEVAVIEAGKRSSECRALSSMAFVSHSFTFMLIGMQWNGLSVVATIVLKEDYGWSQGTISIVFAAQALLSALASLWLMPLFMRSRDEVHAVRDISAVLALLLAVLALPPARSHSVLFAVIFVLMLMTNPMLQGANQIRVPAIAAAHGGGALNGALMGWSRCTGNAGQMFGPVLLTACLQVGGWAPWAVASAWASLVAVWHASLPERCAPSQSPAASTGEDNGEEAQATQREEGPTGIEQNVDVLDVVVGRSAPLYNWQSI